ncbi:MAG: tetratricopeptide repeat protein [Flavobacteriales bacterium]|nr:tetratricopeptide repeat protein [Flavobacteriales bacterium]
MAFILVLPGCSPDKDKFLNRAYHRLTARDNGWFNADEKLRESIATLEQNHIDDFDEVLPVFIYPDEDQAKGMAGEMETCIEKCAVVIDRHSMNIKNTERNKWIDDAYFVVGRSHFYKRSFFDAQRTFDYIGRRFKGQNRQLESKVWLARTLILLEQYARAQTVLDEVRNVKELPKKFPQDELAAVQADLDLHRGKVDDAIMNLERAVDITKERSDRVRWSFILAQLYQMKGLEEKAIAQYQKVVKMSPSYELAFHAQIFQALAYNRGQSEQLRKKLNKMLRDDKHVDHYDMIHYALADLDLKENKKPEGIANLKTSCQVSTTDTKQKTKSYLKLADLYFDDRKYPPSQKYYDSTATLMTEEHPRYEEVTVRAEVLGDLVEQLNIIHTEDSLQAIARMTEEEREKFAKDAIKDRQRQEDEKAAQEAAARDTQVQAVQAKPATPAGGGRGSWYFYNPQQISRGMAEFKKKWGSRKLEDDWRRKDKSGGAVFSEDGDGPEEDGVPELADGEPAWKDPSFYFKDVPKDTAALMASDARICEAMYEAGMIYKERLRDVDNAIESFDGIINRFDDCAFTPEAHYQMYRIYLAKEATGSFIDFGGSTSMAYANIIKERWPDSEFARLVENPDQLERDEARRQIEAAEYDMVYRDFRNRKHMSVINACNDVLRNEPRNHLLAKYRLLKAMAVGGMHELSAFRNALTEVTREHPGTDEAKAAEDILAVLDKGGEPRNEGLPQGNGGSDFKVDMGVHYFVLVHPERGMPINDAKTAISDFNQRYFGDRNIQVENTILDSENQVILLRLFDDRAMAMNYFDKFQKDVGMLAGINDQGAPFFAISPDNYAQLYKNKDVGAYSEFFARNYLKGQ